ncbi:sce7726 family protein [Microbacterium sp. NPDC058269]|uniref:sce7726 family protein n=1 Tax=Microbacterium sp. NPDC058269 TaxID=3346414 RepID=UPI0036DAD7F6
MNAAKTELAASTRMFSSTVIRELGQTGQSGLLSRLLEQSGIARTLHSSSTVGDAFDQAFKILRRLGNRDEYVYRSAITQKILLGQHNLRTASMLGEARVGMSKADVVVFNGTSTAYEIKSERDSLIRLRTQVTAYAQVFAAVNVVTSPSHVTQVLRQVPEEVGVLVLTDRFTLRTERSAAGDASRTDPLAILDFVRVDEACAILRDLNVEPPRVPNTQMRAALRDLFVELDPARAHDRMVSTLKQSRSRSSAEEYIKSLPMSLRAAMLTLKMNDASERRLRDATRLPIGAALAWR